MWLKKTYASEWVSSIVVTKGIRLNGDDLCEPHKDDVNDSLPLPLIGATLLSTLYLQNAYHQVLLDNKKCTLWIRFGTQLFLKTDVFHSQYCT